jgi:hypothetical protein
MHYGTSHFASEDAAVRYYRAYEPGATAAEVRRHVKRKIAEGEISIGKPTTPGAYLNVAEGRYFIKENPTRRKRRRANPHRRRRARPSLRSMMHVRRGARGLTEREARRLAQFERRYDRLVGRAPNPRRKRRTRRRNPRSPLFKLLAHKRTGGKRLVYVGAAKFSEGGRPVYFKTAEGAKVVARLLRLQFPMLKRYAFSVAGA